ncbi:hypothetical protein FIBSPDRAFT_885455 [Athelia psychrophila]|uniref:Uncharacterized protein n=1 Tax=Athelia psychrophila TaxID=1759441 RepID=A0A166RRS9_9AGAM|nr:hypothetical protein FIBSPDRAFT_885455 [Fibularhizoctonia sp. CBS 109695]
MSTQTRNLTYAAREAYRRDVLNIPSPIDEWLVSNARSPRIAFLKVYLMLNDVEAEYVTCRVDMEHDIIAGVEVYRLYVIAKPSPRSVHSPDQQNSPRAMLDFFAGGKDDIAAPNWTQWTRNTLVFQQPSVTFAELFARMATWPLNLAQHDNLGKIIRVFTPERALSPAENTRTHKVRASAPRATVPTELVEVTADVPMKWEKSDV